MRRGAVVLAMLCGMVTGCAEPKAVRATSLFERVRAPVLGQDIIVMDVALLERPAGDVFLNKELWNYTDEQVVLPEQKPAVDDNGFRVGQIIGATPGRLQALLNSPRSYLNGRRRLLPPGRLATLVLGPTVPHAEFQVRDSGHTIPIALDQAQFVIDVVPTAAPDGHTRLRFTPKVEYGENVPDLRPAEEGWSFQLSRLNKTFTGLAWEVTLAANDVVVIGTTGDQPESLGGQAFIQDDGSGPVQRLLVIRTNRSAASENTATLEDLARAGQAPPLAEQAVAAVRAYGP